MNPRVDLIDDLISSGEGPTVDFKKLDILSNPVKLATLMAAFGNTSGGRILIGVNDNGSVEGIRSKKEHETHIMNVARAKCDPPMIPEFSLVRKDRGDIYVVKVARFRKLPYAVRTEDGNVYFIRVGSTVREATTNELALLFESGRESSPQKKPELELLLISEAGEAVNEVNAEPTFVKRTIKKVRRLLPSYSLFGQLAEQAALLGTIPVMSNMFEEKEQPKDLVSIGLQITNTGNTPARGIRVSLKFPTECRLVEKRKAVGGLEITSPINPNYAGLFIDDKDDSQAHAWVNTLGNDLQINSFDKVYVRFPEVRQQYSIQGHVTQYDLPPKDFDLLISVNPKFVEEVKTVYEDEDSSNRSTVGRT
jgi:hypothetical protein